MNFEFIPHISVGPLIFGMTADNLDAILGTPTRVSKLRHMLGESRTYGCIQTGLDEHGKLNHVGLRQDFSGSVFYDGIDMLRGPHVLESLISLDKQPYLWVGSVMLMNLGLSLTGFHEKDDAGKAINFFPQGRYDKFVEKFQPYKPL